jgi:hypothetical protein
VRVLQGLLQEKGGGCDLSVLIQQLSDKHPGLKASHGRSHFYAPLYNIISYLV